MVFIRSSPSFFKVTYILLQSNCMNNGVNNGLKEKKKKVCKQLYMVI